MWHVLIVEDDPETVDFFALSVGKSSQLALAGCANNVAQAKAFLSDPSNRVDVLLTDLGLPDGSGLDVIRFARQQHPECEALVISMFGDDDNVLASIEAGALGYIHKDATPDDIAHTITEMKLGASPISPMIARKVLRRYLHAVQPPVAEATRKCTPDAQKPADDNTPSLSPREQGVLDLVARGFSYAEIARLQGVSVHTVQTHIKNLYAKLSVHSKNEAVFEAGRLGLLNSAER
ncbi:response regulator transcription factor [Rhodoferax sp. GW822-FHT02A01]|uniref:response regulator transcription factor n=1 Tax=Rhodoferax sp. GW822-FHT02A01 TaxID=3141537 RepID=UPI00315D61CF